MNRKKINMNDALKNDEIFLQFLAQEARSDSYRERKKQTEQGPHPPEDMLYDYVLGNVGEHEAQIIREHIAFCGLCAQEVLQLRITEEKLKEDLWNYANTLSFMGYIRNIFSGVRRIYLASGLCAAGICFLIVKFIILQPDPISESYRAAKTLFSQSSPDLSLPWEKPAAALGFTSGRPSPANRAFGAGLWAGRAEISGEPLDSMPEFLSPEWKGRIKKDHWSKTQWEPFYSAGRWCLLAQAVCNSKDGISYEFWEKQIVILSQIQKDFEKLPETVKQEYEILYKILGCVESAIKDKQNRPCKTVASEIAPLIIYLSPESEK
ncbi:MAG: hypothetical protein BWK80_53060 [Desulfobacteraceae bacterium IS3]|nr:MAG: hypothetical protein BWK80_53060 [Desulfobacteraceae bacterium IS3]